MAAAITQLERTEARLKQRLEHVSRRLEELRAKRVQRAEQRSSQQSMHTTNQQVTWL